uniref:C-type lectin domain-containing protein n=1 Tax=Paramormyrops kingsleyae TaxID=1676925 RepID=A0A3B3T9A8_9TELE
MESPHKDIITNLCVYVLKCMLHDQSGLYLSICDHVYLFLSACVTFFTEFYSHCLCFLHQYHFVNINLTWTDAQAYCRENYTDLATIDNMEEMKRLAESLAVDSAYTGEAWIGLKKGTSWRWQWSSAEGGTGYINWNIGQPDNWNNNEHCTEVQDNGGWNDLSCSLSTQTSYFICYTGE